MNRQIDPTLFFNKNLFAYYRMVAKKVYGSSYNNFARHNRNGEWDFAGSSYVGTY
jgi:hypothetical protein